MVSKDRCKWPTCNLPVNFGHFDWCILHDPEERKNESTENEYFDQKIARFNRELQKKLEDTVAEKIDLTGVVFPVDADFSNSEFRKPVDFSGARFTKEANFYSANFNNGASFNFTKFNDKASFVQLEVTGTLSFFQAK